jgi:hypothetical protein
VQERDFEEANIGAFNGFDVARKKDQSGTILLRRGTDCYTKFTGGPVFVETTMRWDGCDRTSEGELKRR